MAGLVRGVLLSCLLFSPAAFAAELLSQGDLLKRLHDANQQRIGWGALARDISPTDAVNGYGEQLARRDAELDRAVTEYAKETQVALPDRGGAPRDEPLGRLEGSAFDAAFLSRMATSNKAMISLLERTRGQYSDALFRRLVNKALATYRDDQRELEKLYEELPAG